MTCRRGDSGAAAAFRGGVALALLLMGGCASAEKRFERGTALEREGRYEDAVGSYVDALRKDPEHAAARHRLREAGDSAIARDLRAAAAAEAAGRPTDGATRLIEMEGMIRRAGAVGVTLPLPADYPELRRGLLDGAIDQQLAEGRAQLSVGDFGAALARYDRAGSRFEPSHAQQLRLDSARFAAHLAWAEADAERGRFRSAHDRADAALRLGGQPDAELDRARRLQAAAVERGTRRVALLPLRATDLAAAQLPDDLLAAFNDALVFEQWSRPPRFVTAVPPAELNREIRRAGRTAGVISTTDAAQIARETRAPLAVALEVDSVRRVEREVRTVRRAVRTRAGVDTAFTIEEGRAQVEIHVRYALIDAAGRRVVDSGTVRLQQTADFRRPRYAGDYRDLDLRRADLELFRGEGGGADRDIVRRLVDDGAPRVAAAVWERVLRRVD
jgi:tetratricopeptide (TPR) repeat protein